MPSINGFHATGARYSVTGVEAGTGAIIVSPSVASAATLSAGIGIAVGVPREATAGRTVCCPGRAGTPRAGCVVVVTRVCVAASTLLPVAVPAAAVVLVAWLPLPLPKILAMALNGAVKTRDRFLFFFGEL